MPLLINNNGRPVIDDGSVKFLLDIVRRCERSPVAAKLQIERHAAQPAFRGGWQVFGYVRTCERTGKNLLLAFAPMLVAVFLFVGGCGQVTPIDDGAVLTRGPATDAVDSNGPPSRTDTATAPQTDTDTSPTTDGGHSDTTAPAPETAPPPSCLTACERCAQPAGLDGPPYANASQCARVIACVRAGDAGQYPWQDCHDAAGGDLESGGLHCAMAVAANCLP